GYTLFGGDRRVKAVTADGQVSWELKAPDAPHDGILSIVIDDIDRNTEDENRNVAPPITPANPTRIVIPVTTRGIALEATILTDRKPTTVVRGATDQGIFGLQFQNESDANIVVQEISLRAVDKDGNDLEPNSLFGRLAVVDYQNASTVFGQIPAPPAANPLTFDFNPPITVPPNQAQAIEFRVDILAQTSAQNFALTIASPKSDIVAKVVESDSLVEIVDVNQQPINTALASGVSVLIDANLSASFYNFPNPFGHSGRPTTSFNYNLQQSSDGTIRIYTLLGELVWSASFRANEPAGQAGTHPGPGLPTIIWDGRNEKGQKVLNGVYVAVLTVNGTKAITKVAVAR
ncbi:MAG: hypothetical protein D6743_18120, partial [Calditrichaeota bacterium]